MHVLKDLCDAALRFSIDVLRPGGHFVCKFYQGVEDKTLELRLKVHFAKVVREKPNSSHKVLHEFFSLFIIIDVRQTSKEAYFVALRRKSHTAFDELLVT